MFYDFVAVFDIYLHKRIREIFLASQANRKKARDFSSGQRVIQRQITIWSCLKGYIELILFSNVRRDDWYSPPTITVAAFLPQIFLLMRQPRAFFYRPDVAPAS